MIRLWVFALSLYASDGTTLEQMHWFAFPTMNKCEDARVAVADALKVGGSASLRPGAPPQIKIEPKCRLADFPDPAK